MDARWLRLSRLLPSGEVVPDDAVTRSLLDAAGPKALACLSDREQEFLRLRYGLDEGKIRTREEVGKEFGLTGERFRHVESKTLAKLCRLDAAPFAAELPRNS